MSDIDVNELSEQMKERIKGINSRIEAACKEAGRDSSEITLIGVSKVFPVEYAKAAVLAGLGDLGENRVQELVPKYETLSSEGLKPNWHLIGTLQKNKVKYIIGKTKLIHSVDSIELAYEIEKKSKAAGIVTDILLQTNVSGEETKHGFEPSELSSVISELNGCSSIRVCGLMTMAPIQQYDGQALEVFTETKRIFDELKSITKDPNCWTVLSMGMSQDFEAAIKAGCTHIRIGTSIFGNRQYIDAH